MTRQDVSAHELLVQLKHGQDEAIEVLYPRFARMFYAFGRKQGLIHEEAEDAVQTTFDRILTRIRTYDEVHGGGDGWMWQVCRNVVIDMFRARRGMEISLDVPMRIDVEVHTLEQWMQQDELSRCLEAAWNSLTETDQRELQRERGRGRRPTTWHQAIQNFRAVAEKCRELKWTIP